MKLKLKNMPDHNYGEFTNISGTQQNPISGNILTQIPHFKNQNPIGIQSSKRDTANLCMDSNHDQLSLQYHLITKNKICIIEQG